MTDIALDISNRNSSTFNDLEFINNDLVLVNGTPEILQNILQTLRVFLGEWFMNNSIGIDYFGKILTKRPNQHDIDAIFINQIVNVPGVTTLNSYNFTPNFVTRILSVSFSCTTTSGIVDYNGIITG